MKNLQRNAALGHNQSGAALLAGLILLIVISAITVGGFERVTMEQRVLMTIDERNNAYQAAETMLRREVRRNDLAPLETPNTLLDCDEFCNDVDIEMDSVALARGKAQTRYIGSTPVAGFQMSDSNGIMRAFIFETRAVAKAGRQTAGGLHEGKQGKARISYQYYIVGPSAS